MLNLPLELWLATPNFTCSSLSRQRRPSAPFCLTRLFGCILRFAGMKPGPREKVLRSEGALIDYLSTAIPEAGAEVERRIKNLRFCWSRQRVRHEATG